MHKNKGGGGDFTDLGEAYLDYVSLSRWQDSTSMGPTAMPLIP